MTNECILNEVYHKYKVKSMIKKLIDASVMDNSCDDLEQQIYMILFIMDNEKLNGLYERNELKKWISSVIKNQRNYRLSEYQKNRFKEHSEVSDEQVINYGEHDYRLDWLDKELDKYNWDELSGLEEIAFAAEYEILKFYLNTGYSMLKIAKQYGVSSTKINQMVTSAKNNIKNSYEHNYDNWINDNTI